jgi:hypothetical protein
MDMPIFSGLGEKLQRVLQALDISKLEHPVWTLKENKGKIYLDICWSKFPATEISQPTCTSATNELEPTISKRDNSHSSRLGQYTSKSNNVTLKVGSNNLPSKKTKKKLSPSTQKRDKQRLAKWLASKKSSKIVSTVSALQPTTSPSNSTEAESTEKLVQPAPVPGNQAGNLDLIVNPSEKPLKHFNNQDPSSPSSGHPEQHLRPKQAKAKCDICSEPDCLDIACIDEEHKQLVLNQMSQCFNPFCKIPASEASGSLKKCTRCLIARYCSRECQAEHWKSHKEMCAELASGLKTAKSTN